MSDGRGGEDLQFSMKIENCLSSYSSRLESCDPSISSLQACKMADSSEYRRPIRRFYSLDESVLESHNGLKLDLIRGNDGTEKEKKFNSLPQNCFRSFSKFPLRNCF